MSAEVGNAQQSRLQIGIRLLVGVTAAATVSFIAYYAAWQEGKRNRFLLFEQYHTRRHLDIVRAQIEVYRAKNAALPTKLDEQTLPEARTLQDEHGQFVDMWLRPIHYRVEKDSFSLFSYGRDGQPGGVGLDADLYAGREDPERESLTLEQFTGVGQSFGVRLASCAAGFFVFVICILQGSRLSFGKALIANLITAIGSLLAAVGIATAELPLGH